MRMIKLLILFQFNVLVLNVSVFSVYAKAPTTAKILFTSIRDGNREIYIMSPDGSEQLRLTHHPANDLKAVWSPTGEEILFISDRDGVRDLYLMDADGSNVRRVFKREADRGFPSWSPDSKQITYTHMRWNVKRYPIYIATLGEQEEEELGVDGLFPAWSPDGTEIAYSIFARITIINVRTRKQKQPLLTKEADWQLQPSWSAVGNKIAFSGHKDPPLPPDRMPGDPFPPGWEDKQTIFIINSDGTGLRQLVDEAGPKAQYPELSPNGEEVLYTQEINGQFQVFKVGVNSGIRTQLTHIAGWNTGGDWFDPAYALPVSPQPQLLTTTWGEVKRK